MSKFTNATNLAVGGAKFAFYSLGTYSLVRHNQRVDDKSSAKQDLHKQKTAFYANMNRTFDRLNPIVDRVRKQFDRDFPDSD
jgi:hypothetical protein